MMTRTTLQPQ